MTENMEPARRWREDAQMGHDALSPVHTRVRLAAMAGHMKRDPVAARRAALADLLADGRPHTREQIWTAVENQLGEGCWGKRREETLWRDLKTLRDGGLRIAYSRRSGIEGYYLQDPIIDRPRKHPRQTPDWRHIERIRQMTVPEKNRQAFTAAEFALQQKRLVLAQEQPDWTSEQVDKEARRLVYGRHEVDPDEMRDAAYVSADGAIVSKLVAFADSNSTRHLDDIGSIIRAKGNSLDAVYLETVAARLGILGVWRRVWGENGPN